MPIWMHLLSAIEIFSLPIIGSVALGWSKLAVGVTARVAERWFLGVLLAVTVITCRTVMVHDPCWFIHTATLGLMIVGALLLPDRESLGHRRFIETWH